MAKGKAVKTPVHSRRAEVVGLVLLSFALFLFVCLLVPMGKMGILGNIFRPGLFGMFGGISWVAPILLGWMGITMLRRGQQWQLRVGMSTLYTLALAALLSLYQLITIANLHIEDYGYTAYIGRSWLVATQHPMQTAGAFGALVTYPLTHLVGRGFGAYLVNIAVLLGSSVFIFNLSLSRATQHVETKVRQASMAVREQVERTRLRAQQRKDQQDLFVNDMDEKSLVVKRADANPMEAFPTVDATKTKENGEVVGLFWENGNWVSKSEEVHAPKTPRPRRTPNKVVLDEAPWQENRETFESIAADGKSYIFPPTSLLQPPGRKSGGGEDIAARARLLEETLQSFGVRAKVVSISQGPVITRFELQPAPGVRVASIANLSDDLALSLASAGVRIEAPVPGKSVVGIEVPNQDVTTVFIRELIESPEFGGVRRMPFALGKDIAGTNITSDLTRMPHLLIAGQTGSGKSVCINVLLTSLLYRCRPEDVQMILIDPKVVELAVYNGIPHLKTPVVTDPKKAAGALSWAVMEMERRYRLFEKKGVRELVRYNEERSEDEEYMPYLLIVVDEMADLMMVAPKDVEESICRIAQKGRACGIHLVVATQRPSVNVITGIIKANIPSRIAFATAAQVDSRTILDMAGAEKLIGRGDMLYYPTGAQKPTRLQGCLISDKEVEQVVSFVRNQAQEPQYDDSIAEQMVQTNDDTASDEDEDSLLPRAVMVVAECGQASTSLLQRRMRVGYARAGRLIDEMEKRGYIGPNEGSKPRAVLISREQARILVDGQEDGGNND